MLSDAWAAPLRDAPSCSIVTPDSADAAFAVLGSAEPAVIRGLVAGLPEVESLLQGNRSVRLVANPTPVAPLKRHGDTLVRPAELSLSLDEAVALLRRRDRGFHAYLSALPLERTPEVRDALPLRRVLHLAGEGVQHANLWVNPRDDGMRSALHYDGHDNLLVQLRGSKSVLLLPPEAHGLLGYAPREERVWQFDAAGAAADGAAADGGGRFPRHARRAEAPVGNHASLDVFADGGDHHLEGEERVSAEQWRSIAGHARICALREGDTLFIPALWSHAVASSTDPDGRAAPPEHGGQLNVAANLWYYSSRSLASFERGVRAPHGWPHAEYCYAEALQRTGRLDEAARSYDRALRSAPPAWGHRYDAHLPHKATVPLHVPQ